MFSHNGPLYNLWCHGLYFPNNIAFLSLKINFVLANSADPDEMPHSAAFHLANNSISSGSSLFVNFTYLGVSSLQRVKRVK